MEIQLTRAERMLLFQIVNVKLDSATLRDHILLERIYNAVDIESIGFPKPADFASEEEAKLFEQYDGVMVNKIENEEHKAIIVEALRKAREKENEIWDNEEDPDFSIKLENDQKAIIKDFFDKDKRTWPRNYHKAIISLNNKLLEK